MWNHRYRHISVQFVKHQVFSFTHVILLFLEGNKPLKTQHWTIAQLLDCTHIFLAGVNFHTVLSDYAMHRDGCLVPLLPVPCCTASCKFSWNIWMKWRLIWLALALFVFLLLHPSCCSGSPKWRWVIERGMWTSAASCGFIRISRRCCTIQEQTFYHR